jgi:hypothetical protein
VHANARLAPGPRLRGPLPAPPGRGAGVGRQTRPRAAPGLLPPVYPVAAGGKPATRGTNASLGLNADALARWRSQIGETQHVGVPLQE